MLNTPWWIHPALLMAGLLYGANYSIAKNVMQNYLEPNGLNLLRALTAVIVFWIVGSIKPEKIDRSDYTRLALCAFFGASLNILLFFQGLALTTPVNAALIVTTSPIVVLVMSRFLLGETVNFLKGTGVIVGLGGAVYLINTNEISFSSQNFIGDLIVFVNISFYSIYLVLVKRLMVKYHPFTVLKWIFTLGLVIIFPAGISDFVSINFSSVTMDGYFSLLYVATSTSVFAYFLNVKAMKHVSPSIVGYYIYLQPLFAGLIEILRGNEFFSTDIAISASLIFIGVFLVSRSG